MKKTLATTLSVIGVLGAGSAAALVNTQVLNSGPAEATASAALLPPADQVDVTIPDLGTLPSTTATITLPSQAAELTEPAVPAASSSNAAFIEGISVTTTEAPSTTTAPAAPAPAPSLLTAFNVGESGVVTVDAPKGQLIIVKAEPLPGWSVTNSEERDDNSIEVTFSSATVRIEFTATFVDGQIIPSVKSSSIPAPATNNPAPAAPTASAAPTSHDDDQYESGDDHSDDHSDDHHDGEGSEGGERDDD